MRTSPPWRTQTPEPRRVPDSSRALTATIESPSADGVRDRARRGATVVRRRRRARRVRSRSGSARRRRRGRRSSRAPRRRPRARARTTGSGPLARRRLGGRGRDPTGSSLGWSQSRSRGCGGPPRAHRLVVLIVVFVPVVGLVIVAVAVPHASASVTTRSARSASGEPASPGARPGVFRRLRAVLPPSADVRDWVELTAEPLPVDAAQRWATVAGRGRRRFVPRGRARPRRRARSGVRSMTYEAYEEPAVARDARRSRLSYGGAGRPPSASRCCTASATSTCRSRRW